MHGKKVKGFVFDNYNANPCYFRLTQVRKDGSLHVRIVVKIGGSRPGTDFILCPAGDAVRVTVALHENLEACADGETLSAIVDFHPDTDQGTFLPFRQDDKTPGMWRFTVMPPRSGATA